MSTDTPRTTTWTQKVIGRSATISVRWCDDLSEDEEILIQTNWKGEEGKEVRFSLPFVRDLVEALHEAITAVAAQEREKI